MKRGSRRIKRAMLILGTEIGAPAAASAVNVVPSAAVDPPPPIAAEPLTPRSVFPDEIDMKLKLKMPHMGTMVINVDDPSRTVSVKYTVQPGAQFPWHSSLRAGDREHHVRFPHVRPLRARARSGRTRRVESFVDAGHGHVHSAYNPGSQPTVFIATFFEAPETGPLLIPADPGC